MSTAENSPSGAARVRFWADGAAYASPSIRSNSHAHHAVQVTLPLRELAEASWVGADVPHGCVHEGPVVLLFIDPESRLGRPLNWAASRDEPHSFDAREVADHAHELDAFLHAQAGSRPRQSAREALTALVTHLTRQAPAPPPLDRRVLRVINLLRAAPGRMPPLPALAAEVELSPSRLKVLFRRDTGLSIQAYVLWLRQLHALYVGTQTTNLARVAHQSGFSDAAHMSRTHRRMFDRTPSDFWRSCRPHLEQPDTPGLPPLD